MKRPLALATIAAAALALLAGCASSSSTSSSGAAAPASTPTQSTPTTSTTAAHTGTVVVTKHGKFGTILAAGNKHLTVYLFEGDKGATSSCTGACAEAWPPVTTEGKPTATGAAVSGDVGTTTRPDGTVQVTYKGHPLYFYDDDKDSGDTYGQGSRAFGADWYVLKPSGSKVDDDSASSDSGDQS